MTYDIFCAIFFWTILFVVFLPWKYCINHTLHHSIATFVYTQGVLLPVDTIVWLFFCIVCLLGELR